MPRKKKTTQVTETKEDPKIEKKTSYFDWLYSHIEEPGMPNRRNFVSDLNMVEFRSFIPNDDNRATDGIQLREEYAESVGETAVSGKGCTLLEMLIALAVRMDFQISTKESGNQTAKLFWEMIGNLRLKQYGTRDNQTLQKKIYNGTLIKKFIDRRYLGDGFGGIFPLKEPKKDQRDVELWYQMQRYIAENYPP